MKRRQKITTSESILDNNGFLILPRILVQAMMVKSLKNWVTQPLLIKFSRENWNQAIKDDIQNSSS